MLHVAVIVLRVLVADLVAELVVGRVLHEAGASEGGSGKEEESVGLAQFDNWQGSEMKRRRGTK